MSHTVNLRDFGGVPGFKSRTDPGPDNYHAIMAALQQLSEKPEPAGNQIAPSKKLIIPDGSYYVSRSIPIRNAVWIEGAGNGLLGLRSTSLIFENDQHGFIILREDVDFDGANFFIPTHNHAAAQGTTIEHLNIEARDPANACCGDGIHIRAACNLHNLRIAGFGGDGVHAYTSSNSSDPAYRGECNNFYWTNLLIGACENGVYVRGADSSAGVGVRIDVRNNRQWGILDWSFLGNTWIAPHANGNGASYAITNIAVDDADTVITTSAAHGRETGDEVTISGYAGASDLPYDLYTVTVDDGVTLRIQGQTFIDPYQSGGVLGYGGPYAVRNVNAVSSFRGAYAETGQGPSYFVTAKTKADGLLASGVIGGSWQNEGVLNHPLTVQVPQSDIIASLGDSGADEAMRVRGPGQGVFGTQLKWFTDTHDGGSWWWMDGNLHAARMLGFTTASSGFTFGRASPAPAGRAILPSLFLGSPGNDARQVDLGPRVPTSGEGARGDIRFNKNPVAGGNVGWVCVESGSPGVWKKWGAIEP